MPRPNTRNHPGARRGKDLLAAYRLIMKRAATEDEDACIDMLTDVLHYCHARERSLEEIAGMALHHVHAEIAEHNRKGA